MEDQTEIDNDIEVSGDGNEESNEPTTSDPSQPPRYNISTYGWDTDVEGLVKRMKRGDIYVPGFQRNLVWSTSEKSAFIESLILGLPVPTIFLAQDRITKLLNIVDGQQRLTTLRAYLDGEFSLSGKNIQEELKGRYYATDVARSRTSKVLESNDARSLADALIHTIVIKPDPGDDDQEKGHEYNAAVIQVFKRLNTSGRPLQAQEIRASIFHGPFEELLRDMNRVESWRSLYSPKEHSRLKDIEAILRYVALLETDLVDEGYKSPMPKFIDACMERKRNISGIEVDQLKSEFTEATNLVLEAKGVDAFKKGKTFSLAIFDAMMVGIVKNMRAGKAFTPEQISQKWDKLLQDNTDETGFIWSIEEFINDTNRVEKRMERAISIFGED